MNSNNEEINTNWQKSAYDNFYIETYVSKYTDTNNFFCGEISISFNLYCIYAEPEEKINGNKIYGKLISFDITINLYKENNNFIFTEPMPQFSLSLQSFFIHSERQNVISYQNSIESIKKDPYKDFYDFILKNLKTAIENSFTYCPDIVLQKYHLRHMNEILCNDMEIIFDSIKNQNIPDLSKVKFLSAYTGHDLIKDIDNTISQETIKYNAYRLKNKINNTLEKNNYKIAKKI